MDEDERARGSDLLRAAGPLLDRANSTLRHSELFDGTYAISSRVKSGRRLVDKILQRRAEGREYGLENVTDIIGMRLINLYRQDVPTTVDSLLGLIFSDLPVDPNTLRGSELLELISYTSNSIADSDPVNVEIKRIFEDKYSSRTKVEFVQKERERYSSVHIVIRKSVRFEGDSYKIPMEIQVRSAFEDVWGEIDHKLLLEMGRYDEPIDEAQRKVVAQHMGVLKKIMDSAADYADVIRRTVVQSSEPPAAIQRSLDGADYVSELCTRLEIPPPLREQLIDILREKARLDKSLTEGHTTASEMRYIDLAQSLAEISPALESIVRDSAPTDCRHLVYLAKMEEALCRLLSGQDDQLQLSLSIYENITKRFPEYPTGWFRMGQALQRRSDKSDDIDGEANAAARAAHDAFAEARRRLREIQRQPDDTRILFISPGQESYIRDNAARLQAFVIWRLSDRRRRETKATKRDLDDVLNALQVAEDALSSGETQDPEGRLSNGAAFYVSEATVLSDKLGTARPPLPTTTRLAELISRVEAHLPANPDHRILHWDTVVRVQELLGNVAAAKAAATNIMDLISDEESRLPARRPESTYVAEAKARAVQHAWKLVRPLAG